MSYRALISRNSFLEARCLVIVICPFRIIVVIEMLRHPRPNLATWSGLREQHFGLDGWAAISGGPTAYQASTNSLQSAIACGLRMKAIAGISFGARGTESSFKPASCGRRSALRWFTSLADQTRFSHASLPPRERGTTWSRLP